MLKNAPEILDNNLFIGGVGEIFNFFFQFFQKPDLL